MRSCIKYTDNKHLILQQQKNTKYSKKSYLQICNQYLNDFLAIKKYKLSSNIYMYI